MITIEYLRGWVKFPTGGESPRTRRFGGGPIW